ncbi:hypothetical protein F5B19DRAFT_88771 [Rostrohypoxylon terebratum]|nr:hypothetical protein F5B19DRAFT_88771 [Rostrohypoxylon terebratum]
MDVDRVNLLVVQLRGRIKEAALLQRRIYADMDAVFGVGDDMRWKFEEIRGQYLNLLRLKLPELRTLINQSDTPLPTDIHHVENVMKRVLPVTERYLRRLVNDDIITEGDMDCILVGGYKYVEDFFYDIENNVGAFGMPEAIDPSEGDLLSQEEGITQEDSQGSYDEDGFFVVNEQNATMSDTGDAEEKSSTTMARPGLNPPTPPVSLLPPSEPFSWADDVEEELSSMEQSKQADEVDQHLSQAGPLPIDDDRSPVDASFPSDSSDESSGACTDTDSDASSDFDCDVDQMDMLINSTISEPQQSDSEHEKEEENLMETRQEAEEHAEQEDQTEKTDVETGVNAEEGAGQQNDDAQLVEPYSEATMADLEFSDRDLPNMPASETVQEPIPADFPTYRSLSTQSNGDDILDEWLMDEEMWYWQFELLFIVTLAAKRYKHIFEEARGAYRADPFADD